MTDKQVRFVEEYCVDFNATQAAVRAGYSERTAYSIGWENLRKPEIADAIKERMDALAMSAEEALLGLSEIARSTIADCIDVLDDGGWRINLKRAEERGKLHLVHELGVDRSGNPKLKVYDRHAALRDIAKVRGLFGPKGTEDDPLHNVTRVVGWPTKGEGDDAAP